MYAGHSLTIARRQAQANANRDGRPRYICGDSSDGFHIHRTRPTGLYGQGPGIQVDPQVDPSAPVETRADEFFQSQELALGNYRRAHRERRA